MKTDDLIAALSTDLPPASGRRLNQKLFFCLIAAALLVLMVVGFWLGFRADIMPAIRGPVFWAKGTYTASLAVGGFWLLARLGRPGASARAPLILLGVVFATAIGLALIELLTMPMPERMPAVMGDSARACVPYIFVLSLLAAPLVFWAARAYAPTRPALAGAAAGLLTAGLAATLYGLHCPEYTAAFVAVWYSTGVAVSATAGALIGRIVLRW